MAGAADPLYGHVTPLSEQPAFRRIRTSCGCRRNTVLGSTVHTDTGNKAVRQAALDLVPCGVVEGDASVDVVESGEPEATHSTLLQSGDQYVDTYR